MTVEGQRSSAGTAPDLGACKNAEQFVIKRLNGADETKRPAQLADEYGCSNAHMRKVLGELMSVGVVRRVAHGEYAAVDGDSAGDDNEDWGAGETVATAANEGDEGSETSGLDDILQRQREFSRVDETEPDAGDDPDSGDDSASGQGGIPIPVSPNVLIVAAVVLVVLLALTGPSRSSGTREDLQDDSREDRAGVLGDEIEEVFE